MDSNSRNVEFLLQSREQVKAMRSTLTYWTLAFRPSATHVDVEIRTECGQEPCDYAVVVRYRYRQVGGDWQGEYDGGWGT